MYSDFNYLKLKKISYLIKYLKNMVYLREHSIIPYVLVENKYFAVIQ